MSIILFVLKLLLTQSISSFSEKVTVQLEHCYYINLTKVEDDRSVQEFSFSKDSFTLIIRNSKLRKGALFMLIADNRVNKQISKSEVKNSSILTAGQAMDSVAKYGHSFFRRCNVYVSRISDKKKDTYYKATPYFAPGFDEE